MSDADLTALLADWTAAALRIGAQHDVADRGRATARRLRPRAPPLPRRRRTWRTVLRHVDGLAAYAADADIVRVAAWFHDAVYDADRGDNEVVSAGLAETVLDRLDVDRGRSSPRSSG